MTGAGAREPLTSTRNPRVQSARRLKRRGDRDSAGAFLIEGRRAVLSAIEAGAELTELFVEDGDANDEVRAAAAAAGVPVTPITTNVASALSDTSTPQGVVAVALDLSRPLGDLEAPTLVLVLAGVSDPGNAGTLVRSAVAAGADAVVFTDGSVDPLAPKTVRAAAGALFGTKLVRGVTLDDAVASLRALGLQIIGAEAGGAAPETLDLDRPVALVLGNEAWGLPAESAGQLDATAGIPMPGPAESLNVGIAGSILLFEVVRRRRLE